MLVILERQDRLVTSLQIFFNFGVDVGTVDNDTVRIINGCFGEVDVIGFLEILQVLGVHPRQLHLFIEASIESLAKPIVIDGINDF